ncbi:MAG: O-antigen ligase family protein [Thermodesulfobacterium sp.]|nr:O-antigen ligase family protein [Thermodesulfobacterium sp.]
MSYLAFWITWVFVFIVPWENVIVFPGVGTVAKIGGIVAIVIGSLVILTRGKLRWHPFHTVSFLFVFWSWASLFWSIDPESTLTRSTTYTGLWLITLVIYQFANTEARCQHLMRAYVFGAWVTALATIESYLQGIQVVYHRYAASGFDPNEMSFYLGFAIPMAWYLGAKTQRLSMRALSWGLIPIATVAVLLTGSRSGALGCGLALVYVVLSISRLNWKWRLAGIGLAIAAAILAVNLVPPTIYARLATLPHEVLHGTLNERTVIWRAGIKVFAETPLLGVGAGAFRYAVAPILGTERAPHNVFLSVTAEKGLIGLILWLGMMAVAFKGIFKMSSNKRLLWLALFAILFLAFLTLNFEWRKASWLIMALAIAHARKATGAVPIKGEVSS